MTTNYSQEQSFGGKLVLDLSSRCFCIGYLYVAFSRATHPSNVIVYGIREDRATDSVVYPEEIWCVVSFSINEPFFLDSYMILFTLLRSIIKHS